MCSAQISSLPSRSAIVRLTLSTRSCARAEDVYKRQVFEEDGRALLVDMGRSARCTKTSLAELGIAPEDLGGILVTHEHSDHVAGLKAVSYTHLCVLISESKRQQGRRKAAFSCVQKELFAHDAFL